MPDPTPDSRDRDAARRIAREHSKDYDHEMDEVSISLLAEDIEAALSTARREGGAEKHALLLTSARELLALLRDKWACPDADAMTLYLGSILAGIAEEWNKNPPENGFTHALDFPGIGRLQIDIRKIEGKSVAESLLDVTQRLEDAERKARALEHKLREALWYRHGCTAALYGDDGEMQCNACFIDFKRMSIDEIETRLLKLAIEAAAKEPK